MRLYIYVVLEEGVKLNPNNITHQPYSIIREDDVFNEIKIKIYIKVNQS